MTEDAVLQKIRYLARDVGWDDTTVMRKMLQFIRDTYPMDKGLDAVYAHFQAQAAVNDETAAKPEEMPLGYKEALAEAEADPDQRLYVVEIGLFDMNNDPSTPMETHEVLVAAEDPDVALDLARSVAEENIPVVRGIAFSPISQPEEYVPDA